MADEGVHHRRLRLGIGLAGHDPHRIHHLAILVHIQTGCGGIDQRIAPVPRRQRPRPLEIEHQQPLLGFIAVQAAGDRLAQLAVDRVHPADALNIIGKVGRLGGVGQQRARRRRHWFELRIDIDHPDPRIVAQVAGVGDEGRAEHHFGALDRARTAAHRIADRARHAARIVALGLKVVGLRGGKQLEQLLRRSGGAGREPQGRPAASAVEFADLSAGRGLRDRGAWRDQGQPNRHRDGDHGGHGQWPHPAGYAGKSHVVSTCPARQYPHQRASATLVTPGSPGAYADKSEYAPNDGRLPQ